MHPTPLRLAQRERADLLAARHRPEEALLLLLRAEVKDHLRRERVVHAHQHGGGRVGDGDLLEREEIRQRVESKPVILLGNEHAEEAQRAELADDGAIEVGIAVPLRRVRREPPRKMRAS
jgi:hypothetical protein